MLLLVRRIVLILFWALAMPIVSGYAQSFPDRPVALVVPWPAGGPTDRMARVLAELVGVQLRQPVVIENRTGAAGNIGAEFAYNAAPDGYTLFSSPPPPLVINQNLYPKLGFDPAKFEPVIVMAHVPNALIVNPKNLKASSVAELVAYLQLGSDPFQAVIDEATLEVITWVNQHVEQPAISRRARLPRVIFVR